jgi:hypothetical protein
MSAVDKRTRESITLRGIAASIQAMAMPTFNNLKELLSKYGWRLNRVSQTNKPEENESNE